MDVGGEIGEVNDLGDPRAREAELANDLSLVAVLAPVEGSLEPISERQGLRDTSRAARGCG